MIYLITANHIGSKIQDYKISFSEASTTSINKRIKWSSTYVPITESDEISCPDSNDEMIKIFENGFTEWETLHDRNITCEDGELEDGDFCFFVSVCK